LNSDNKISSLGYQYGVTYYAVAQADVMFLTQSK